MTYESDQMVESKIVPGVRFRIAKMSFGRRIELTRRIRELAQKLQFLQAGDSLQERMDAALLCAEIDRLYMQWGLKEVNGLELDGVSATPELLIECGPEELLREVLGAVKGQCGLTETERKNS
jgi:hypothetical protein